MNKMRKILAVVSLAALMVSSLLAASYNDNKYQRMADECIREAEKAKMAGLYDKAVEYADKAGEYAELSRQFILQAQTAEEIEEEEGYALFPEYYIVGTWSKERDCFWNIAARSYVYNNPWQWRKLYEANKGGMPNPNNPNIIKPGMKLFIPSIKGEERSGVYDPDVEYGTLE